MSQYTYDEVADWFLAKGNGTISPKKLQKLVYYAYAWTLTLFNDDANDLKHKLFDDGYFEAWVHGPVIRGLYAKYADYGFDPIPAKEKAPDFTADVEDVLNQVWDVYGHYSADELESMTHQESPWQKARQGKGPLDISSAKISDKDMFECYVKRIA